MTNCSATSCGTRDASLSYLRSVLRPSLLTLCHHNQFVYDDDYDDDDEPTTLLFFETNHVATSQLLN